MFQQSLGHRRRSQGDEGESRHHVRQAVSAVEAVFEFRQVALRLFRIERVVAGAQGRLQVAEHRVDPVELVFFHRGAAAAASLAAQIRIVQLHQPRQALLPVALEHRLHQRVLHAPGRVVRNSQLAMQMHRRNTLFALRQQVDRLEPHCPRQLLLVEDGAAAHRGLALAAVALAQLARVQVAALVVAAVRTHEAVRPAHLEQLVKALVLVAVLFHEFVQAEAFLELDRISSHG